MFKKKIKKNYYYYIIIVIIIIIIIIICDFTQFTLPGSKYVMKIVYRNHLLIQAGQTESS